MTRAIFLFISVLLLSTTIGFSQDSEEVKDTPNKKRILKQEEKREKEAQKLIEKENKKYQKDKQNSTDANYTPTYSVTAVRVTDSIYMLKGKGGNIGVCMGTDGVFMVDDQFAEGSSAILNTISRLTTKPVQFLVNTHFHGDHTGGNKNMLEAGIVIFSQENVRKKMLEIATKKIQDSLNKVFEINKEKYLEAGASGERAIGGAKRASLAAEEGLELENNFPMITFKDDLTFHYNDEKIIVMHVHNAHTDGDAMVYFTDSNVLHTGDLFFNGKYPFVDTNNGGSFDGYINGLSKILMIANEDTKIIPGHGEVATIAEVKYAKSMMENLTGMVGFHYLEDKSLKQILAMKDLTKQFDDQGYGNGFISTEKFITAIYDHVVIKYQDKKAARKKK